MSFLSSGSQSLGQARWGPHGDRRDIRIPSYLSLWLGNTSVGLNALDSEFAPKASANNFPLKSPPPSTPPVKQKLNRQEIIPSPVEGVLNGNTLTISEPLIKMSESD